MGVASERVFDQPDDASTPLTPAEMGDLIPSHIAFRRELNEAEQENIVRAHIWALGSRRHDLLSERFVKDLHRRMLGDVWRWAGKFRTSERNLGIDYWEIPVAVRQLLDDARWVSYNTYPADEIGVRFHHRLVQIHPFPNGNGRHSRLMADLLVMQLGRERLSWGRESLSDAGLLRQRYIQALRAADDHDLNPLLAFARA